MRDGVLVLFPGALGDFVCLLPTVAALERRHPGDLTIVAKPEWLTLLRLPRGALISIDRSEIADLFTDGVPVRESTRALLGGRSHVYSWTGAGDPVFAERLGAISAGPVGVYAFRGMAPGEHAADYYARCTTDLWESRVVARESSFRDGTLQATQPGAARWTYGLRPGLAGVAPVPFASLLQRDDGWFADLVQRHDLVGRRLLVIHPGSGSPAKNWTGFAELAEHWHQCAGDRSRVVLVRGPAESQPTQLKGAPWALSLANLTLPQVAALLQACDLYAGNDSGISHLAGAVGAKGVVVFGSTDPSTWGPRGAGLTIVHAPVECSRCGPERLCTHRLSVERVGAVLGL